MLEWQRRRGLTLIEIVVALAIVAILLLVGVPSMRSFMMQQRLKAATSEFLTDLQAARAEALRRTEGVVTVVVRSNATTTCYGTVRAISAAALDCDCARAEDQFCRQYGTTLSTVKRVNLSRSDGVSVAAAADVYFSAFNGMAYDRAAKTITVSATAGGQLQLNVSATGLSSICIPSGSNLAGFPACS